MTDQVTTSQEGMSASGQEFANHVGTFSTYRSNVSNSVDMLLGTWHGQASANFANAMQSWDQTFGNIINDLNHMAEVMGIANRAYTSAEEDAIAQAGNFGNGLPNF